ncbi:hypothetical protein TWF970_010770 [Orbilia oligospora]|uniref:Uncharacterized protein n=1 Tax=Orbilia oligospora TaxID=2813651 RepID=A0A7C8VG19_ORBOL|nr:hypothetical protein TWF970_010770 [Orbilia oligospora]
MSAALEQLPQLKILRLIYPSYERKIFWVGRYLPCFRSLQVLQIVNSPPIRLTELVDFVKVAVECHSLGKLALTLHKTTAGAISFIRQYDYYKGHCNSASSTDSAANDLSNILSGFSRRRSFRYGYIEAVDYAQEPGQAHSITRHLWDTAGDRFRMRYQRKDLLTGLEYQRDL